MQTTPAPPRWKAPLSTPLGRLFLLALLLFALQLPLSMIRGVVNDRALHRAAAASAIAESWGGTQTLVGPLLRVGCVKRGTVKDNKGRVRETVDRWTIHLLPEDLDIDSRLQTQTRKRGLFEVPVYSGRFALNGHFVRPTLGHCGGAATELDWSLVALVLGIGEPRGLGTGTRLVWNGLPFEFQPGTGGETAALPSGVHVPLAPQVFSDSTGFELTLQLNGSERLLFAPMGRETRVAVHADWPHPSFQGSWLPVERKTRQNGFEAHWSISYLGRNFPQVWKPDVDYVPALGHSLFGVQLLQPVDTYVMAQRIAKYATLTVIFTFLTVWLTEILSGRRVHPIQYGFLGAALCLFGLLQLALAEHLGFLVAFLAAAAAVTGLVTLYSRSVLQNGRRALAVGGLLAGLYAYLYSLLRAEDYALLGGTLALFALLALAMYLTRRIDWSGGEA